MQHLTYRTKPIFVQNFFQINRNQHRQQLRTDAIKFNRSDPYKTLGLEWGATSSEAKAAYRKLCLIHHPDVAGYVDQNNLRIFHRIQAAYDSIMSKKELTAEDDGLYSFSLWRKGDNIAQKRTDIAGQLRKRPSPPVGMPTSVMLDFTSSVPVVKVGGDLISDGSAPREKSKSNPNTVATGISKWVTTKPYVSWNKTSK